MSTESPARTRERTGSNERLSAVEPTETAGSPAQAEERTTPIVIAHMFPDLLNLYGDGGNVRILIERLAWRGIPVQVRRVEYGESVDLGNVDLVFLGGGPDREQKLASAELMRMKDELAAYVEEGGPVLAICGGYQILGKTWLLGDEEVPGLDIVGIETRRPGTSADRLIDNIVLSSPLAAHPVVGYENHAGRTYLAEGVKPFGAVVSSVGHGNNDADKADGALYLKVLAPISMVRCFRRTRKSPIGWPPHTSAMLGERVRARLRLLASTTPRSWRQTRSWRIRSGRSRLSSCSFYLQSREGKPKFRVSVGVLRLFAELGHPRLSIIKAVGKIYLT